MSGKEGNGELNILVVEDNRDDVDLLLMTLKAVPGFPCRCEVAANLSEAFERLSPGGVHVILLDLGLPDSIGFGTFERIYEQYPDVPIIILSGLADEDLAIRTVGEGAQDYLVKGNVDGNLLTRSIRYAIERHKIKAELRSLSLLDDLTGLYNRRGFLTLARQQMKIAARLGKKLLVIYADMDGLKRINDNQGHKEGDRALKGVSDALNRTFRASDLIGRMGGDEFAVVGIEESEADFEKIKTRLEENLKSSGKAGGQELPLSLSVGIARYNPDQPKELEELLAEADQRMYQEKMSKSSPQKKVP